METTLYVGNLPSHRDADAVQQLLSGCGKVLHLKVMTHPDFVRRHGGFAIAEMATERDAQAAVSNLDNSTFRGHTLAVRAATTEEVTEATHSHAYSEVNSVSGPADEQDPPTSL
jgi:RNA recognition motif-containing protein